MKTKAIPPRHNKTIWYISRAKNVKAMWLVLKFILNRYLRMVGLKTTVNDELLVFIDGLKIYFAPLWAELDPYNGIFVKKTHEPFPVFVPENCQVILDCGANIGIYALRAALCGTNRVFSIEPNPLVFNRLIKNIKTNNLTNVIALNTGIGSARGKTKLYWGNSTTGGSIKLDSKLKEKNTVDIEITTLDDIVERYNINSIDIIKMDIEGSEYEALIGAKRALDITKTLILEYHSEDLKNKCESLLQSRGFKKLSEIPEHQFYINSSFNEQYGPKP